MQKSSKDLLRESILLSLMIGASAFYQMPTTFAANATNTTISNNTLPSNPTYDKTIHEILSKGNIMDITQNSTNGVIKWGDFSIGANATVNFKKNDGNTFHTLNYVTGKNTSLIYGRMNAAKNGNIYLVNPNGVQIGNSAQISVGSLYVSNKKLDETKLNQFNGNNLNNLVATASPTNAELMNLGNVNADKVTFDGDRVVLDVDRISNYSNTGGGISDITVNSTSNDVVLASDTGNATGVKVNGKAVAANDKQYTYTWIKDITGLQNINKDLTKNYALKNSIDAIVTKDWKDTGSTTVNGFKPLGDDKTAFTGKFDGLNYSIFGLNINRAADTNVGLFGKTNGASIKNVQLIGGGVTGNTNVGALVGNAQNTTVSNIISSLNVTGDTNVGGIAGKATGSNMQDIYNNAVIQGNTATGGLIGSFEGGKLTGESYNFGKVESIDKTTSKYIGGLVGDGNNITIGNATGFQMSNINDIEGGSNIGGIIGRVQGNSTIQNVKNEGNITATGKEDKAEEITYGKADINANAYGQSKLSANVANVGGIVGQSTAAGGSKIQINNVLNSGNIQTSKDVTYAYTDKTTNAQTEKQIHSAGNVGGIVGLANNTTISEATNEQANISGSHNVGGIVGHLNQNSLVTKSHTEGGTVSATGSRNDTGFARIDKDSGLDNIPLANVGGIAGYVSKKSKVASSDNSANISSEHYDDKNATNLMLFGIGGIAGRVDELGNEVDILQNTWDKLKKDASTATIYDSFNTGKVDGDRGVGGIAGAIYNGSIANSYNEGNILNKGWGSFGGIVGDARGNTGTNRDTAQGSILYNVYNKGTIGDSSFNTGFRHVGGLAGHMAGIISTAYNTGNVYNTHTLTGGLVGWLPQGYIYNSYNAGNVTVKTAESVNGGTGSLTAVGGIVGGIERNIHGLNDVYLQNIYNLGTVRAMRIPPAALGGVGGIIGSLNSNVKLANSGTHLHLDHVYTTGNIFSDNMVATGYIIGAFAKQPASVTFDNVFYIKADPKSPFANLTNGLQAVGPTFTGQGTNNNGTVPTTYIQGTAHAIEYGDRYKEDSWRLKNDPNNDNFFADNNLWVGSNKVTDNSTIIDTDITDNKGAADNNNTFGNGWRKYDNTLPILNVFRPEGMDKWFATDAAGQKALLPGATSVQFGNAYNPYLSFITTGGNGLTIDATKFTLGARDGIVADSDLTINNFSYGDVPSGYNGTLFANGGNLTINGGGDITLGLASNLYGNSIDININNKDNSSLKAYGNIQALGTKDGGGNVNINSDTIRVVGNIKASDTADGTFALPGLSVTQQNPTATSQKTEDEVTKPDVAMPSIGDEFAVKDITSKANGNITITAADKAEVLAGSNKDKTISSGGAFTVTGNNEAYVDSNLTNVKGDVTLTSDENSGQSTFDISNTAESFINNHTQQKGKSININGADGLIGFDSWDEATKKFKLGQDNTMVSNFLYNAYVKKNGVTGTKTNNVAAANKELAHLWVASGEQLKGIQDTVNAYANPELALQYNFALKNDIKASDVTGYESIAGGNNQAFNGVFNGRGYSIANLNIDNADANKNVGIFGTIGATGVVKNLVIDDIRVKGNGNVGIIAGTNNGTIDNIETWGGDVSGTGNVGGIVGTNAGTTQNIQANNIVKALSSTGTGDNVGGIAGVNNGTISDSESMSGLSNSGENNQKGISAAMGGIAGVNNKNITTVVNKGVTSGLYDYGTPNPNNTSQTEKNYVSDNVGGIVGVNNAGGSIDGASNESVVKGGSYVGGVAGTNNGTIQNVANSMEITSQDSGNAQYVGGVIGSNNSVVNNARNNGTITGEEYVGGIIGLNDTKSDISNTVNDKSAKITGENYVGGIAGENKGTIDTSAQKLENRGAIIGQSNVGGLAGKNSGTINGEGLSNEIELHVKDKTKTAENFGGVVGHNTGTIIGAANKGNLTADGATNVGGIVGQNEGTLEGAIENSGTVTGKDYVGGIVGINKNGSKFNTAAGTDTVIKNSNAVISTQGAGGIIGKNEADLSGITMENSGRVTGANKVGGLIGENTGNITKSSLYNTTTGTITGTQDVGGLIGVNSGTVTGGRDDNDNYYKYQIYNNGTIKGDTNVGGLIGNNSNNLTAGYNTGSVNGKDKVGGIIGTNSGKIDQVFNTLANGQTITGTSNVGGLIGENAANGTLSNAYNTSEVTGTTNAGSLVGNNAGTLNNVYGKDKLVGTGNGTQTNAYVIDDTNGTQKDTYQGFDENIWRFQEGHTSPMLKAFLTKLEVHKDANIDWNKLLTYNGKNQGFMAEAGADNKVYIFAVDDNGTKGQQVGYITAADETGAHSLADYLNTKDADGKSNLISSNLAKNAGTYDMFYSQQINTNGADGNPNNLGYDFVSAGTQDVPTYDINKKNITIQLGNVDRTYGDATIKDGNDYGFTTDGWVTGEENLGNKLNLDKTTVTDGATSGTQGDRKTNNAGDYTWSGTINGTQDQDLSNYDFTVKDGTSHVDKAKINIKFNDVNRTYGDDTINKGSYDFTSSGWVNGDNLHDQLHLDKNTITDGGLATDPNRKTNNAGDHKWSGTIGGMDALTNYEFGTTTEGNSHVDKAKLNIKFNDVNRTYGDANLKDGEKYDFTTSGWVNGDNDKELHKQLHLGNIKDGALANDPNRTTNDAGGNYTWSGTINGKDSLTNYDIVNETAGKSSVDKAKLTISADDETIIKGDTPTYTGKHDGLANGDTWEGIGGGKFAIADNGMENQTGSHDKKIGVWIDGKFYAQDTDTFKNYDIKINPGTLIVKDKPTPDKPNPDKPNPDKPNPDNPNPDNPNPDNPNKPDTQLNKYYHDEWDKDYTDRERRAVFNFIDEGTDVGQDLETDSEETDTKDENKDA